MRSAAEQNRREFVVAKHRNYKWIRTLVEHIGKRGKRMPTDGE
jgi:hypothetical protein